MNAGNEDDGDAAMVASIKRLPAQDGTSWSGRIKLFPVLAGSIALLLAMLGGLGWILGAEFLTSFIPDMPTMKPATSAMLMALSIALLLNAAINNKTCGWVAGACAGFVILLGVTMLITGGDRSTASPLWLAPSVATSLTLLLLAISLGMLQWPRPAVRVIAALSIFGSLLPLHRIITFIVGHGTLQTTGPFDSMSLPTAMSLFLLACGIFSHPRLPYAGQLSAPTLQGRVLRLTLPWTILIPPVVAVLFTVGIDFELYNIGFVIVALVATLSVMMTALLWPLSQDLQNTDDRRSKAECILREKEAYANQIIEVAPDALMVVDERGHITRANLRMEQLFGYRREELLGQSVEMLLPERFRKIHPGFVQSYLVAPTPRYMGEGRDLFARRKDGSEVAVEIGLAPLHTSERREVLANIIDISARLRTQAEIEAALKEKTLLLNEVHHRVKNNLQIVASLLSLQAGMVDDPTFSSLISESESRVRAMALMHQILYERKDFANVDLDAYLQRLSSLMGQIHGAAARDIAVQVDSQPLSLDLTRAIPLGLIVNELLCNVFKHAFPEEGGGKVWVELYALPESSARLVVRDNGRGLPGNSMEEQRDGLGMQIVDLLAEQIGSSLETGEGPGGHFELHFQILTDEQVEETAIPHKEGT